MTRNMYSYRGARIGCVLLCAALWLGAAARPADQAAPAPKPAEPAFQANTDESKVGEYTLPDPLKMQDGTAVTTPKKWMKARRPEILRLFQREVYGIPPKKLNDVKFEVTAVKKDALGGKATRKMVHIRLDKHPAWGGMDLMIYIPNGAPGPVPAFVGPNFQGNHAVSTEADVPVPKHWVDWARKADSNDPESVRGKEASRWPIERVLARGYAVATVWYFDLEPDRAGGWKDGLRGAVAHEGATPGWDVEKDWSAIGAWAWGLSRALDYLKTDAAIDGRRVAVIGHSRLGKTALWAGASDPRFAIVISNDSGEGGAALARRNFGESMISMKPKFPYWFCERRQSWIGRINEMPIDQHMLIALAAPRPVYIASASDDTWADPKGEFLAGKAAEPVYALFGKAGLGVAQWPKADQPVGDFIGYHLRTGKHDMTEYDWRQYLDFADRHYGRK